MKFVDVRWKFMVWKYLFILRNRIKLSSKIYRASLKIDNRKYFNYYRRRRRVFGFWGIEQNDEFFLRPGHFHYLKFFTLEDNGKN